MLFSGIHIGRVQVITGNWQPIDGFGGTRYFLAFVSAESKLLQGIGGLWYVLFSGMHIGRVQVITGDWQPIGGT